MLWNTCTAAAAAAHYWCIEVLARNISRQWRRRPVACSCTHNSPPSCTHACADPPHLLYCQRCKVASFDKRLSVQQPLWQCPVHAAAARRLHGTGMMHTVEGFKMGCTTAGTQDYVFGVGVVVVGGGARGNTCIHACC